MKLRPRNTIRIATYNVHACIGRDGEFRPERIAAVLAPLHADFIALQEVEDRTYRGASVTEFLARHLGMHAYRGLTLRRGDSDYGNLLLARQAATSVETYDISVSRSEPRGAIDARFSVGRARLRFLATHLGLRATERNTQARSILARFDPEESDISVLAGDMNEWRPASFPMRVFRRRLGPGSRNRTFPARSPILALDRIYVRPHTAVVRVHAVKTGQARWASDHLPLVCDVACDT